MEMAATNWYVWFTLGCVIVVSVVILYRFFKMPTAEQLANVREWMLYAVIQAEKEWGSGTGRVKLRQVYDWFVQRFPALALVISFQTFAEMIDDALEEMRTILNENKNVARKVNADA